MRATETASYHSVTPTGAEHSQQYSTSDDSVASAAHIDAVATDFGPIDPDLAAVVSAWPALPEAVRRDIVATVRRETGQRST